jgi:hypothetical protein
MTVEEKKHQRDQEILSWVRGADRYNQNLDSHLIYASNEIIKLCDEYSNQQLAEYKAKLIEKIEAYIHADSQNAESSLDTVIFDLIDSIT